jgi:hypothetical protein
MDLGPQSMARLMQSTSGKQLGVQDAFAVAEQVSREVQRTVTPTDPTKGGGPTDWIDEASNIVAAHWPGAVAKVAESMNISKDYAQLEDLGKQARMADEMQGPQATYVRSLKSLLSAAGVDVEKADAAPAAFQLLQAKSADQVPVGIVQAILAKAKLPAEATDYFAKRLADTGGQDGNVQGLLDSIELARRDAEAKQPKPDPTKPPTEPGTPPTEPTKPPAEPGTPPTDQGTPPADQGTPPADPNPVPPADQGAPPADQGTPPADHGTPPADAGKSSDPAPTIPNPANPQGGNPGTPGVPAP